MLAKNLVGLRTVIITVAGLGFLLAVLILGLAPDMTSEIVWAGIGLAGGGQGKQIVETLIGKRQAKTRSSD